MAEETTSAPSGGGKDAEENKAMAAIGYLGILFLVPLLAAKIHLLLSIMLNKDWFCLSLR